MPVNAIASPSTVHSTREDENDFTRYFATPPCAKSWTCWIALKNLYVFPEDLAPARIADSQGLGGASGAKA